MKSMLSSVKAMLHLPVAILHRGPRVCYLILRSIHVIYQCTSDTATIVLANSNQDNHVTVIYIMGFCPLSINSNK